MTEELITNEKTGGKKGAKPEKYSLLPWEFMDELARVYHHGSIKYDDWNWTKGYDWSLSFDSLIRHATAFWRGEDLDPDDGLPHLAHCAWHCLTLMYFMKYHPDLDNRHIPQPVVELSPEAMEQMIQEIKKVYDAND